MEQMILGRVLGWHMFLSVMLTADLLHGHCFLAYDKLGCWRVNTTCSMIRTANQLTSNGHPPVTCVRGQRLPRIHSCTEFVTNWKSGGEMSCLPQASLLQLHRLNSNWINVVMVTQVLYYEHHHTRQDYIQPASLPTKRSVGWTH